VKAKIILCICASVILVIGGLAIYHFWPKNNPAQKLISNTATTPGYYKITKVVDGDTFEVNMDDRIERVRLIGLDTPETKKPNSPIECFGIAASNFAHQMLDNQQVRLEADPINTNRDRYGRLLRYAYLKDGQLVNAEMIKKVTALLILVSHLQKLLNLGNIKSKPAKQVGGYGQVSVPFVTKTDGQRLTRFRQQFIYQFNNFYSLFALRKLFGQFFTV
jgi:micrococcal nuclease